MMHTAPTRYRAPFGSFIARVRPASETTEAGIVLPEGADHRPPLAEVLTVGGWEWDPGIKPGDQVILNPNGGGASITGQFGFQFDEDLSGRKIVCFPFEAIGAIIPKAEDPAEEEETIELVSSQG